MGLTNNILVIQKLHRLLDGMQWCLIGSTNLALQGVDIEANDIDLQVSIEMVDVVNKKLSDFVVRPITYSENEEYRSYFGQFKIDGILVEIMTKNAIKLDRQMNIYSDVSIQLGDNIIACACLQEEYDIAIVRNQNVKAQAILKKLSEGS